MPCRISAQRCGLVSLGGGVATAVAERMRDEVGSLVLSAPVGFGRLPLAELAALPMVRELARAVLPHVLCRLLLLEPVYRSLVTHGSRPTEELRRQLAADAHRLGPGVRAAVEALAAASRSSRAFYRRRVKYSGRVSVVWGDRDALVSPSQVRGVLAAMPQAQVHLWPGMGHHPQRERPQDLAELVEAACELRALDLSDQMYAEPFTPPREPAYRSRAGYLTRSRIGVANG